MNKYVSKKELSQKNRKKRSSMTATEMAVHSALMKQGDNARALVDTEKNIKSRAASLGLFSDKLSFAHFFTKKVDISVNNTRFKGKRGHQVRGGVVPITTGLVADYNPAVMRADKNRDQDLCEAIDEEYKKIGHTSILPSLLSLSSI